MLLVTDLVSSHELGGDIVMFLAMMILFSRARGL